MKENNKTILIADDDQDYLEITRFHVESFGFKTLLANNQKECEEMIENEKFDLAILDLMMENDDSGFILSYKLKKKNDKIPVMIVSAVSMETGFVFDQDVNTSWFNADKMLEKGIRPDQLSREINKLLKI